MNKLKSNLKNEMMKEDHEEVYFSDKFRRVIRKITKGLHDDNHIEVNFLRKYFNSLSSNKKK
jgi:hypothetical protein